MSIVGLIYGVFMFICHQKVIELERCPWKTEFQNMSLIKTNDFLLSLYIFIIDLNH